MAVIYRFPYNLRVCGFENILWEEGSYLPKFLKGKEIFCEFIFVVLFLLQFVFVL